MKVAMIGCGKLGLPCAEVMSAKYDVVGYDLIIDPAANIKIYDNLNDAVAERDIIFIAVPTPHEDNYSGSKPIADLPAKDFDYSIVKDVLIKISKIVKQSQIVVLISTVLPGTIREQLHPLVDKLKLIYNPYLIAMGSVKWDMVNPECLIIGTETGTETDDVKTLIDFYKPLMKNDPVINIGTWDEAEAIKIFYNTFISAKIGLVNMIQDVAESNGNINVDVVTDALKKSTQRITGPKYLTAGMGDAGACHPRDNIALRYLSQKLNLGYDLFHCIMHSRDIQAKRIAHKLISLSKKYGLPIVIHGRSYKPYVPYTIGSYSELIGYFIEEEGHKLSYADPLTNDFWTGKAVILMAHNPAITYLGSEIEIKNENFYFPLEKGSVILDPWRTLENIPDCIVVHYGNSKKKYDEV